MKDLDFKIIGNKIKERRTNMSITQEMIANKLDVNPSHISNIECGRSNPSLTVLIKIANILECSVDYFIDGEYTYKTSMDETINTDKMIMDKVKYYDPQKKERILKILDFL